MSPNEEISRAVEAFINTPNLGPDEPIPPDYIMDVLAKARLSETSEKLPQRLPDHASHSIELFLYENGRLEVGRPGGAKCIKKCSPQEAQMLESFINSIGVLEKVTM